MMGYRVARVVGVVTGVCVAVDAFRSGTPMPVSQKAPWHRGHTQSNRLTLKASTAASSDKETKADTKKTAPSSDMDSAYVPPFNTVMAANRGEIAVRIMRGAIEQNIRAVTIYGYEDRNSAHRWAADQVCDECT